MPHSRITLKNLAQRLSVSHTTVSLALRNHPSISKATKSRVKVLARKLGYRPDPMLQSLVAYRQSGRRSSFQGVLGWLTNYPTARGWHLGQQVGFHTGAVRRARELGYSLAEFWLQEPGMNKRRLREIMIARNVQGLIVAPQPAPHTCIDFYWEDFAAVSLGYSLVDPQLNLVMNHQFRNMSALVRQLIGRGYRAIGLVMPASRDERVDHNYLAGYLVGLYATEGVRTLSPHFPKLLEADAFFSWFGQNQPDAIVTEAGSASQLSQWLHAHGYSIPGRIGLALVNTPYRQRQFSGIDENPEYIGATAVDSVVGLLHRNEYGVPVNSRHTLIEGTWQEGRTIRPAPTFIVKGTG